jgi:hypothetical protein
VKVRQCSRAPQVIVVRRPYSAAPDQEHDSATPAASFPGELNQRSHCEMFLHGVAGEAAGLALMKLGLSLWPITMIVLSCSASPLKP